MKFIDDIRRENLALLITELGSSKALAELLGRDAAQVSQWKQGSKNSRTGRRRGLTDETARWIEDKAGKPSGWLDVDHGVIPSIERITLSAPMRAWEHVKELPHAGPVFIPSLTVESSLQDVNGQVTISLVNLTCHLFDSDFIAADQLSPAALGVVLAPDETMQPTIERGDRCVVDTSQTKVQDGRTFAIYYDGLMRLRRLFGIPGGGLRIETDNSRHPTLVLTKADVDHVTIIGRVVQRSGIGGL